MKDTGSQKYLVYFFLYLAVVCELLIIIVERDDAEIQLLREQRQLRELLRTVVEELIRTKPVAVTTGTSRMEVGERRTFVFSVTGLGSDDDVNEPPSVVVSRNGILLDSITVHSGIREARSKSGDSLRHFEFDWVAPAPGTYDFHGSAATNHVWIRDDGMVKIGTLELPLSKVREIVGDAALPTDEIITSAITVEVVAPPDQLNVSAADIVTVAGFPATNIVQVHGTSPNKVRVMPSVGTMSYDGGFPLWLHTFSRPGSYRVRLDARDSRGGSGISVTQGGFTVLVAEPSPRKELPDEIFTHETAEIPIAVTGLDDMERYSWTVSMDGAEKARGTGITVHFKPEGKGLCTIQATYGGVPSPVKGRENSTFVIPVFDPPYRIVAATFEPHGEYPINQKFQVRFAQFGRKLREYMKHVPPSEIRIDVEDAYGKDLLDGEPQFDVSDAYTDATFYLKGRVSRDGTEATIRLRAGALSREFPVILYRE